MSDTKTLRRLGIAFSLTFGVLGWSASATAQDFECRSDTDCAAGSECVKGASAPGCADPSEGCPDPTPVEDEYGFCERAPIRCLEDADCPAPLQCTDSGISTCSAAPGMEPVCDEPDPSQRTCQYVPQECTESSECPDHFGCEVFTDDCIDVACPEGASCPPSTCEPESRGFCVPEKIDCEQTSQCPGDWTCETFEGCDDIGDPEPLPVPPPGSGSGSDPGGGSFGSHRAAQCVEVSLCAPPFFEHLGHDDVFASAGGDGASNSEGAPTRSSDPISGPDGDPEVQSGCSVASIPGQDGGLPWILAGAAAFWLRRRR